MDSCGLLECGPSQRASCDHRRWSRDARWQQPTLCSSKLLAMNIPSATVHRSDCFVFMNLQPCLVGIHIACDSRLFLHEARASSDSSELLGDNVDGPLLQNITVQFVMPIARMICWDVGFYNRRHRPTGGGPTMSHAEAHIPIGDIHWRISWIRVACWNAGSYSRRRRTTGGGPTTSLVKAHISIQ